MIFASRQAGYAFLLSDNEIKTFINNNKIVRIDNQWQIQFLGKKKNILIC